MTGGKGSYLTLRHDNAGEPFREGPAVEICDTANGISVSVMMHDVDVRRAVAKIALYISEPI
jgi:hypothetical protein